MSRLLTLLLLYRSHYSVGKYISLEMLVERTKESYYDVLHASSIGWHQNENDERPFVEYYLGIILKAYGEFESRVSHVRVTRLSKPQRIEALFETTIGTLSKQDILRHCPDISVATVERTLATLVKSGVIEKVGRGRTTTYVKTQP